MTYLFKSSFQPKYHCFEDGLWRIRNYYLFYPEYKIQRVGNTVLCYPLLGQCSSGISYLYRWWSLSIVCTSFAGYFYQWTNWWIPVFWAVLPSCSTRCDIVDSTVNSSATEQTAHAATWKSTQQRCNFQRFMQHTRDSTSWSAVCTSLIRGESLVLWSWIYLIFKYNSITSVDPTEQSRQRMRHGLQLW